MDKTKINLMQSVMVKNKFTYIKLIVFIALVTLTVKYLNVFPVNRARSSDDVTIIYDKKENQLYPTKKTDKNILESTGNIFTRKRHNVSPSVALRNNINQKLQVVMVNATKDLQNINKNLSDTLSKHIIHRQNSFKKYAVISVTVPNVNSLAKYNYVFPIPLTIVAWKRIGYESIVLISGNEKEWLADKCLKVILNYIKELHCLYVFMDVSDNHKIMVSQVSRIFAATLLTTQLKDEDYLLTSDVDLWPLDISIYNLKPDKEIVALNSACCGSFKFKNVNYRMVPMSNIGASVKTWKQLIVARNQSLATSSQEIITYLKNEFGDLVDRKVVKGENEGWYMDQRLVSMLLSAWFHKYGISKVDLVPRNTHSDRVDRVRWSTQTIQGKVDAHILENLFRAENWLKVLPLLRLMYGGNEQSSLYTLLLLYYDDFNNALMKR